MAGWCIVLPSALPAVWVFAPDDYDHAAVWVSAGDHLAEENEPPATLSSDGSRIWFAGAWFDVINPMELYRLARARERRWLRTGPRVVLPIAFEDLSSGDISSSE